MSTETTNRAEFFTPEAEKRVSQRLLQEAIEEVRITAAHCLRQSKMFGFSRRIRVCEEDFLIPGALNDQAVQDLKRAIDKLSIERTGKWERSDIPVATVRANQELFALLYVLGYLQGNWSDQIQDVPKEENSTREVGQYEVVTVFRGLLEGNAASGDQCNIQGNSVYFDSSYVGGVSVIIAKVMKVKSGSADFVDLNPTQTAKVLLEKFPSLAQLHTHPEVMLEAVVRYLQNGAPGA